MVQRAASPVRLQQKPDYSENGNPLIDMASNCSAELQRPYPGLTERRGGGGGSPRFLPYLAGKFSLLNAPMDAAIIR